MAAAGLAGFLATVAGAIACECIEGADPPTLSSADAVFVGLVVGLDVKAANVGRGEQRPEWCAIRHTEVTNDVDICVEREIVTTFQVASAWKGVETRNVQVVSGLDSCSFDFRFGQPYLVFANRGRGGRLEADICSGTGSIQDSRKILDSLGEPTATLTEVSSDR